MNIWGESPLYRLWVIGGMIGVVAFAVIGGLSDPTNQDFILYLIPVIAVYMFGILFLQGRGLRRDRKEGKIDATTDAFVGWQHSFAIVLCVCIFVGVFAYYAGFRETLHPFGDGGIGFPIALIPPVLAALYGAARTMNVLRGMGGGDADEDAGPG